MQQYSPVSEIVFTIFSLFFGGPSLTILDQVWGRDLTGEAGSTEAQLLVNCHLYTAQDPFGAYRQSSFWKRFCILVDQVLSYQFKFKEETKLHDPIRECRQYCGLNIFSLFWWTKSLHHKTGQKKEEFFLVKPILLWVSYYWPMQTVLWPKKLFLFFFFKYIHTHLHIYSGFLHHDKKSSSLSYAEENY